MNRRELLKGLLVSGVAIYCPVEMPKIKAGCIPTCQFSSALIEQIELTLRMVYDVDVCDKKLPFEEKYESKVPIDINIIYSTDFCCHLLEVYFNKNIQVVTPIRSETELYSLIDPFSDKIKTIVEIIGKKQNALGAV
jgi:hypothetical protein